MTQIPPLSEPLLAEAEDGSPHRETSYQRVLTQLRKDIVEGVVAPGAWLRTEALADRCGVSAQPIREALQRLEGEGLVEILPNRGARVRGIDRNRLQQLSDLAEAMEAMLARRFAEDATMADLRHVEALQRDHDIALDDADDHTMYAVNLQFHKFINAHRRNPDALRVMAPYQAFFQLLRDRYGFTADYRARVKDEHYALIDAFRARDPVTASELAAAHVRGSLDDLLICLRTGTPSG